MIFTVRELERRDFAQWKPLWDSYNAFYGRSGATALADEITAATWSRFFDVYEPMHGLVAESSDKLVGLVHYLFHRSTTQIAPACYLQDLYTSENLRGQGIGAALIRAVYARATEAGIARVYWQTHETNATARRLYDGIAERSGFIVYKKQLDSGTR